MTIWDELRIATAHYMSDAEITPRHMAEYLDCSESKMRAFLPKLDKRGRVVERTFERPTMAEPALSALVELLRDNGYIEPRVLIPRKERG